MNVSETFSNLFDTENQKEFDHFFASMTKKKCNELKPFIRKTMAKNSAELRNGRTYLSDIQTQMFQSITFHCLDYKDLERDTDFTATEDIILYKFPWYKTELINRYLTERSMYLEYPVVLEFMDKGWFQPSESYLAQNIVYGLRETIDDPRAFNEHFWLLFTYETNVYIYDDWIPRIKQFVQDGKVERLRLLTEALLTTIRDFKKPDTGWFCKLFEALEPTAGELLSLQNELFLSLSSKHSKPVTQALKYLKQIETDPAFDLQEFIVNIPILMTWDVKSIVTMTLGTIDRLIKHTPEAKEALLLLAVDALAFNDETVQVKLLKLLQKHRMLDDQSILEAVAVYEPGLYHSAKALFPERSRNDIVEAEALPPEIHVIQNKKEPFPVIETFEDMLFFFSSAYMDESANSLDLFIALLPKLDNMITDTNLGKLEPLFSKVFNICYPTNFTQDHKGAVTKMMAITFARYGLHLTQKFSSAGHYIETLYEGAKAKKPTSEFLMQESRTLDAQLDAFSNGPYDIAKRLLQTVFKSIVNGNTLPLISQPTYLPSAIASKAFLKSVAAYQTKDLPIDPTDWQVGIERLIVDLSDTDTIKKKISGEYQKVLLYLYGAAEPDWEQITNPLLWTGALLRVQNEKHLKRFADKFDRKNASTALYCKPMWEVQTLKYKKERRKEWSDDNTFYAASIQMQTPPIRRINGSIYHDLAIIFPEKTDLKKILNLIPGNIQFFLEHFVKETLAFSTFADRRAVNNSQNTYTADSQTANDEALATILSAMSELSLKEHENVYLFVAASMLYYDKTVRTLAAELWIKAVSEGTMNSSLLGETLGKLEAGEYAPLKRFTDLIVSNLLGISALHNKALETVLLNMIPALSNEPITGTKKLLELYLEVLVQNESQTSRGVLEKLEVWKNTKTLHSVLKKII